MATPLLYKLRNWEQFAQNVGYKASGLARLYGISERHLRRTFNKEFGSSPQSLLDQKRMKDAQAALGSEQLVKEIASDLHYKHPGSFSHWFRTRQNMTPSQFARRSGPAMP